MQAEAAFSALFRKALVAFLPSFGPLPVSAFGKTRSPRPSFHACGLDKFNSPGPCSNSSCSQIDPDPAHSGDNCGCDHGAQSDTASPKAVRIGSIDAVGDQHQSEARRDVTQYKENAERIVRDQPDIPGVMDKAAWGADREIPVGRDAQKRPCIDKDRVYMSENED